MKTKQEIRYFMNRLYRFFEAYPKVEFKRMNGIHGMIVLADDNEDFIPELTLDPRKDLFSTIIHEGIHYMYPHWCETDVLREEKTIVNSLTPRQVKNILKRFAEVL